MINPYLDPKRIFVIYRHIRPDTNMPFYIGLGKSPRRPYKKIGRNIYWQRIVNKNNGEYRVDILFDNLTEQEAIDKEVELIKLYGRVDLKTGCLCNLTDGGEGMFNLSPEIAKAIGQKNKGRVASEETRRKISEANKGQVISQETRDKIREGNKWYKHPPETIALIALKNTGSKRSDESRKKMSESRKGIKMSAETRERMSKSKKGVPLSEAHKRKMSEVSKGRPCCESTKLSVAESNRNRGNKYLNIETGVYYENTDELAEYIGMSTCYVRKHAKLGNIKNIVIA